MDPGTEPWLPFARQPMQGEYIIVSQTGPNGLGSGETSPKAAKVIPVPDPLPCPGITQGLHNCSSFISLDALIPGAEITVQVRGATIVQARIERPSQAFQFDPSVPFGPGDVFIAFQTAIVNGWRLSNCYTESLPVTGRNPTNPPSPRMQPPPKACTGNATFEDLMTGASLYVENQRRSYSANIIRGGTQEISWARFNVPWIEGPITSQQRLVAGHPELTQTRSMPISRDVIEMLLPEDWALTDPSGAVSFQFLQQTACGASPWSSPFNVKAPISSLPQPVVLPPLHECSQFIYIQHATPDCQMYASTTAGTHSSRNFTVTQTDFILHTNHQCLVRGTEILVVQFGCGRDWNSEAVPVSAAPLRMPSPQMPNVLRPGAQTLEVSNVVPGATVAVLVDGKQLNPIGVPWPPEVAAISPEVTIRFSQPPGENQLVLAIQKLCGNYSSLDARGVIVSRARLTVTTTPRTLVKGQATSFRVDAVDAETNTRNLPFWGAVTFEGLTFGLGDEHIFVNLAATEPRSSINGVVAGSPYNEPAFFTIALANPVRNWSLTVRAQPIPATIPGLGITVNIDSLTFDVLPTWDPGSRRTLQPPIAQPNPGFPTIAEATATLPIPTGANNVVHVTISGRATANLGGSAHVLVTSNRATVPYEYSGNNNGLMSWSLSGFSIVDSITGDAVYGLNAEWAGSS
ncbi:hypothetical protein LTR50_007189 [Elasticomyces elasticus]|nr:hypothetical protein LTR50_007189 [Elasticomyces elasticus]